MDRLISEEKVLRVVRHIIRWMDCNDDKSEIIKHAEEQIKAIPTAHKTCEGCPFNAEFVRGCDACRQCSRFYSDMYTVEVTKLG